ncbi:MAG: hypothetical protein D6702_08525 [Planctomycetota bacterium]|nr:MAG: hypothetical protein D6702_08525 [Planctomycetota bacterium]
MSALGGLFVVLAAWLGGRALLPARSTLARSRWEEACLAWAAGTSALTVLATALAWLGLPLSPAVAWGMLGAAAIAGLGRLRRDRRESLAPAPGGRPLHLLLAILAAATAAGTLVFPLNEFDPLIHFALKGKLLAAGADPAGPAFTGVTAEFGRIMTHPNYPLGIPILEALTARIGGGWDDRWVQLPLAFWTACLPGLVAAGLRPWGEAAAGRGALLAASIPILVVRDFFAEWPLRLTDAGISGGILLGGGGDLALAACFAAACALLVRARRSGSLCTAAVAGLCLAGGAMLKNEGAALLAVLALAQLLVLAVPGPAAAAPTRPWRPAGVAVALALLLATPWFLHRSRLPSIDEAYSSRLTPTALAAAFRPERTTKEVFGQRAGEESEAAAGRPRAAVVAGYFAVEAGDLASWGLLWPLFLLGLPLRPRRGDPERRWLALAVLGGIAAYALVLLIPPWYLPSLRATGIPERLLVHLVGPAAMTAAAAVGRRGAASMA